MIFFGKNIKMDVCAYMSAGPVVTYMFVFSLEHINTAEWNKLVACVTHHLPGLYFTEDITLEAQQGSACLGVMAIILSYCKAFFFICHETNRLHFSVGIMQHLYLSRKNEKIIEFQNSC